MRKPKISCIYLDMDGVIADFVKRYKELYRMEPREAEKKKEFNKFFDEFIALGETSAERLNHAFLLRQKFSVMLGLLQIVPARRAVGFSGSKLTQRDLLLF